MFNFNGNLNKHTWLVATVLDGARSCSWWRLARRFLPVSLNKHPLLSFNAICTHSRSGISSQLSLLCSGSAFHCLSEAPRCPQVYPQPHHSFLPCCLHPLHSHLHIWHLLPAGHLPIPDSQVASSAPPLPVLTSTPKQRPSAVHFCLESSLTHSLLCLWLLSSSKPPSSLASGMIWFNWSSHIDFGPCPIYSPQRGLLSDQVTALLTSLSCLLF